jgi:AcrR family transcriptional regulator
MTEDVAARSRARGRPRAAGVDERVLAATLELIGRHGLSGWTLDTVATDAGVSKPAIYRRWESKRELVLAAVSSLAEHEPVVPVGDIRTDLVNLLHAFAGPAAAIHHRLALRIRSAPGDDDLLLQRLVDQHLGRRRDDISHLLRDAVDRGELSRQFDVEVAAETLLATTFAWQNAGTPDGGVPSSGGDPAARVVDLILDGMRAS